MSDRWEVVLATLKDVQLHTEGSRWGPCCIRTGIALCITPARCTPPCSGNPGPAKAPGKLHHQATVCCHACRRLRAVLDEALAAAGRSSAQTHSSVLQQLRQARELYDSDREASCKLVQGLMRDAEVGSVDTSTHTELLQPAWRPPPTAVGAGTPTACSACILQPPLACALSACALRCQHVQALLTDPHASTHMPVPSTPPAAAAAAAAGAGAVTDSTSPVEMAAAPAGTGAAAGAEGLEPAHAPMQGPAHAPMQEPAHPPMQEPIPCSRTEARLQPEQQRTEQQEQPHHRQQQQQEPPQLQQHQQHEHGQQHGHKHKHQPHQHTGTAADADAVGGRCVVIPGLKRSSSFTVIPASRGMPVGGGYPHLGEVHRGASVLPRAHVLTDRMKC